MASIDNEIIGEEPEESKASESRVQVRSNVSVSRRMLIVDGRSQSRVFGSLESLPDILNRIRFLVFGSSSTRIKRSIEERDEVSGSVSAPASKSFLARIRMFKCWIRDPLNMALFIWITAVAISLAILLLVASGVLNQTLPQKSERDVWIELNNQILNALLTLMCLYQHPRRFHHLVLLCRWKPEDISRLRKIYCKNGSYKPHEWVHIMVVVILLHINCFAQYGLCSLNLCYKRSERPAMGVVLYIFVAIAAAAVAGVYSTFSPLGKEYESQLDEENQDSGTQNPRHLRMRSFERRYTFVSQDNEKIVVSNPRWSSGIVEVTDDISSAFLSLFCTCCVFGWNVERLGFGNMYVHISTFILFCSAPFLIFSLAAINIGNEAAREALGLTGIILCALGLLYGGFWRMKMRRRFNLPGYDFCCKNPAISDCVLWLFCCWCSLAQEVRTGNSYDMAEDKRCEKEVDEFVPAEKEDSGTSVDGNEALTPPSPILIQREGT